MIRNTRFSRSFVQRTAAMALLMALAACTSVKLDEAPVDDRSAAASGAGAADQGAVAGAQQGGVDGVTVPGIDTPQPAGLERVVYFDFDSYDLRADATPILEANARYLRAHPDRKVNLEGHTDERGSREYNLALGQKRADAVRRALALMGIPDSQMEAVSFGEERPAVVGYDEGSYAQNRRVELVYR
jgi:peptidoglycan-associated lipoprotein